MKNRSCARVKLARHGITGGLLVAAIFVSVQVAGTVSAAAQPVKGKKAETYVRSFVQTGQHACSFGWLKYELYIPKDYAQQPVKKYPCILYLHGLGQTGDDPEMLKTAGLNKQLEDSIKNDKGQMVANPEVKKDFPFIVVSPQLPGKIDWSKWPGPNMNRANWWNDYVFEAIDKLLDQLVAHYAIDEARIYCAGASMGGYGTWKMVAKYPRRFAAVSPQCGDGDPATAPLLKGIPIWVFHGNCDEYMPVENSDAMVAALKKAGANVKYTRWGCKGDSTACKACEEKHYGDFAKACKAECMECNHFKCYNNQFNELYNWFLEQHK